MHGEPGGQASRRVAGSRYRALLRLRIPDGTSYRVPYMESTHSARPRTFSPLAGRENADHHRQSVDGIRRKVRVYHFDQALERIKKATGARTQVQLAEILGIRQSSISDAKRRNSVPADWYLKLYRIYGLNPDWLADSIEPVYLKPGMGKFPAEQLVSESPAPYGLAQSRGRVVLGVLHGRPRAEKWENLPSAS